jgi:hypothetical protein
MKGKCGTDDAMFDWSLKKFEGYTFRIDIPNKESFDPMNEVVEVILDIKTGERYSANFVAIGYIPYVFEKNIRTRECASGTYFCMPNMIIVRGLNERDVKATIDDLIENLELESYFKKID